MNCWGWGTWKNNWKELENNLQNKIKEEEITKHTTQVLDKPVLNPVPKKWRRYII